MAYQTTFTVQTRGRGSHDITDTIARCVADAGVHTGIAHVVRLLLGTWQGVFLWEHRTSAQRRDVVVTVLGA